MMKTVPRIIVQLIHIHGPLMGTIQEFSDAAIEIGRHPSCHLSFPRELAVISRRHASIKREGNRFEIIDTSTNGTFLNGQRISRGFLKDGDVLMFTEGGPKVSFLTRMEEGSPSVDAGMPPQPAGVASGNAGVPVPPPAPASPSAPASAQPPSPVPPPPQDQAPPPVSPSPVAPPPGRVEGIAVEVVMAPLVIQYGPMLQSFKEVPITVGSGADCDVVLDHPMLVARHAQFFFSGDSYWIKDLTGKSQVRINNQPIETAAPLNPEDRLGLTPQGPTFRFLAGGRLAEIVEPRADIEPPGAPEKEPEPEKPRSLFKRFFK
ncbi:MAG: FHA domain-containing protein [Desulfobacteraceae bacterium]|nr:FHA domain-containing protein [Desulfobacteraceae bacterium]